LDVLAELQKRGFQVVQCPGRVEISTNKSLRMKAQEDGVTVAEQVNEAIRRVVIEKINSDFDAAFDEASKQFFLGGAFKTLGEP
jgi:hypothetical protein